MQTEKKSKWKRFWITLIILPFVVSTIIFLLNLLGNNDFTVTLTSLIGYIMGLFFLFFFYKMIRPINKTITPKNQYRTIQDIFISKRNLQEVKAEVMDWIHKEKIIIEIEQDSLIRGRLGIPSGLGLTAPKYFEVSLKSDQNGVIVHTEGWISIYGLSEMSFSKTALTTGGIPRKKGWKVIEHLWKNLRELKTDTET